MVLKLDELRNELDKLKNKYKELFNEIEVSLVKLQTYNRIIQEFPEAAEFLPERNVQLMINVKETRNKLSSIVNENKI